FPTAQMRDALGVLETFPILLEIAECLVGAQDVADAVSENDPVDRFADEIRCTHFVSTVDRIGVVQSGQHQYWHERAGGSPAQFRAQSVAIHSRHYDVEQDDVRCDLVEALEGSDAVV